MKINNAKEIMERHSTIMSFLVTVIYSVLIIAITIYGVKEVIDKPSHVLTYIKSIIIIIVDILLSILHRYIIRLY